MFDKRYKVKHFKSRIYNPIRGKIFRAVTATVCAAVLFTIGWFAYKPLMSAINDANKQIVESEAQSQPEVEKKPAELPKEFLDKETVAVTVPTEKLYDQTQFYGFLASLDSDVTAVVIDMKTKDGEITYKSPQASIKNVGAQAENAIDLESYMDTAKRAGFDVILRIFAFEDHTAPYNAADMAIRYESEEGVLWLDDSVDNGGKPWLNPYSDTAQKYVLDIVYDAIDLEADAVLLDGLCFPPNCAAMEYAYFGVGAEESTDEEILRLFMKRVYSAAVTSSTDVIAAFDGYALVTEEVDIYGGSPLTFDCDGFAPNIVLSDFVGKKINGDINFDEIPTDTAELVRAIYTAMGFGEETKVVPIISCEGLAKQQLKTAARAIDDLGATGYIVIYDEALFTGVYPEEEQPVDEENSSATSAVLPAPAQSSAPTYTPPQSSSTAQSSAAESRPNSSSSSSYSDDDSSENSGPVRWG